MKFDNHKSILIDTLPEDLQEIIKYQDKNGLRESIYNPEIQQEDAFQWIDEEKRQDYSHLNFIIKFENKYYKVYWTRYQLGWDTPRKDELWERLWEVIPTQVVGTTENTQTTVYNLVTIN